MNGTISITVVTSSFFLTLAPGEKLFEYPSRIQQIKWNEKGYDGLSYNS